MRVLLVEDDPQLGDGLMVGLRQLGHAVDWLRDGASADRALKDERFDAVVLDLGLPRLEGLAVLRQLRARQDATPVLILTARDALDDKLAGLDGGADDYLVKPVAIDELAARLRALARRAAGQAAPLLRFDTLEIDPAARAVRLAGMPVELSTLEFNLLCALAHAAGRVLTRQQLEGTLYGWRDEPDSNALDVHIHHLRRKLGSERIRTLRGVGYMMPKA